jgi:hypothetical protein
MSLGRSIIITVVCLCGHSTSAQTPNVAQSAGVCEAEAVALLCCATLDLPGVGTVQGGTAKLGGGSGILFLSAQRRRF